MVAKSTTGQSRYPSFCEQKVLKEVQIFENFF